MLQEGDKAPAFKALATTGPFDLYAELEGGPVVLFFYPKALTPGCTHETLDFEGFYDAFLDAGVQVAGCSTDDLDAQQAFQKKFDLRIPLLVGKEVCEAFGTIRDDGRSARVTFAIAQGHTIAKVYETVDPKGHAEQVLTDVGHVTR